MDPTPAREQILKAGDEDAPRDIPSAEGLAGRIVERFPGTVPADSHGQPVVHVALGHWEELARYLRDSETFDQCVLLTAVDHLRNPGRPVPDGVTPGRFEVVAAFLSHAANRRLRAIAQVADPDVPVPSLTGLFPGVELPEREVYDLFGLRFEGHPDLVRLLMPDDWEGHPLRKDYPAARVPVQFKATGAR